MTLLTLVEFNGLIICLVLIGIQAMIALYLGIMCIRVEGRSSGRRLATAKRSAAGLSEADVDPFFVRVYGRSTR